MLVRTKTPRIKKIRKERKLLKEKNIPWREVYQRELKEYGEAGIALRGCRCKEEMTQQELAEALGISQHHISEMECGKRSIGKVMAKKLAKVFHVDYRVFL